MGAGQGDGGVDGYYIDIDSKVIYFIQSKFRATEENYHKKAISPTELLKMDITRIMKGHKEDDQGVSYSSQILDLIENIATLAGVAAYKKHLIILANVTEFTDRKLRRLFPSDYIDKIEVYDFEKSYNQLLFPIIKSDYHSSAKLILRLDLSELGSSSARIKYPVTVDGVASYITVAFVPTNQIASAFSRYHNALLRYNPRSFLSLSKNESNQSIRSAIIEESDNKFALYNNGITIVADTANYSDATGKVNRGILEIENPQIINGGQTAYTLSEILDEVNIGMHDDSIFDGKEVLIKVITLDISDTVTDQKLLIENVSRATNQQSLVTEFDRRSNDPIQVRHQSELFELHSLYYQRKTGEYHTAIKSGLIEEDDVIDSEVYLRLAVAMSGKPGEALNIGGSNLFKEDKYFRTLDITTNDIFPIYEVYKKLKNYLAKFPKNSSDPNGLKKYGHSLNHGTFAFCYAFYNKLEMDAEETDSDKVFDEIINDWKKFEIWAEKQKANKKFFRDILDRSSRKIINEFQYLRYYKSVGLKGQLDEYYKLS